MQAAHMRLASDFEEGHMRIVKQENYMKEEGLGGQRKVEVHKRIVGHALFWVQVVYKKALVLLVCATAQMQAG